MRECTDLRIYISGKIGEEVISDATRQKFARAEKMLEDRGNHPVNITGEWMQQSMRWAFEWQQTRPRYEAILLYDLHVLSSCRAIYMLEDWKDSPGAKLEFAFARAIGILVFFQDLEDAQLYRLADEIPEDMWVPL